MVVVKFPELENRAIEPFINDSSGALPPKAPPRRTWFHESARPRQFPPKRSTPFIWQIARMIRESLTETFSVRIIAFSRSGLSLTASAIPSLTPEGGRYTTTVLNL